jgi:flagellar biosynthesis/type III secretory pathway protein FliH
MIRLPEVLERQFLESVYQLEESKKMPYVTSAERFGIEKGIQQGMQQGMQQGEATIMLRLMARKYGVDVTAAYREQIEKADPETLLEWSERLLFADKIEDIFH